MMSRGASTATSLQTAVTPGTLPCMTTDANGRPESWFWAHDVRPEQIASLVTPGMRLIRLSSYGAGPGRRFAALLYQDGRADSGYELDLDGPTLPPATAITVDDSGPAPLFAIVLKPATESNVYVDLDEAAATALLAEHGGAADIATYRTGGARQYAVVLDLGSATSLIANVTMDELTERLRDLDAVPIRLRAHDGEPRFTALAWRTDRSGWFWYTDLDADQVARVLERHGCYPVDLDASRTAAGVRFTVVMRR
jgi:hypothetical protein